MSYKFVIIAPYPELATLCREVAKDIADPVEVYEGIFNGGVQRALEAEKRAADVIISRGATAAAIRRQVGIPVVDILTDDSDLLNALYLGSRLGDKLAVVTSRKLLFERKMLEALLHVKLQQYVFSERDDLHQVISVVKADGFQVVIGGIYTVHLAQQAGLGGVLIRNGKEAILRALGEARNTAAVRRQEKIKAQYAQAIMDFAQEGIIAIDQRCTVTVFNRVSEDIFGLRADQVLGRLVNEVIPNTRLDKVLMAEQPELGELQKVQPDTYIVTNRVPIRVEGQTTGVVAMFKDATRLQEYERKIRRHIQARGHVARYQLGDILGNNKNLLAVKRKAAQYAQTDSTILITGESGTGKEMFAQGIHNLSKRKRGPFVAVNCSAIPENLLESELFGYEEGAFTGAKKGGKQGLFLLAHGGTIFLDEIGSVSPTMQTRLLRVLQEREIRPIGSNQVIPINVRVIAAANTDLLSAVEKGAFRADLFYRLNVLTLSIPPLRERKDDIPLLALHFLKKTWPDKEISLSESVLNPLVAYHWPGNVRELENVMERIAVFARKDGQVKGNHVRKAMADINMDQAISSSLTVPLEGKLEQIRKRIVLETLRNAGGNKKLAAERLGISRTQLWRIIKCNKI
ncbi:MAG: sigma 54-interacting transcriptional regulator [bacterium]|jgi:PAS domain S-box-containing protein